MIESQFERARQKGKYIGPESRMGRGITSATGARDRFHQDSILFPLLPGSLASFSLSANFSLSGTKEVVTIKIISSQISREKGPPPLPILGVKESFGKGFWPTMYELLGQLLRSGGQDQGSSSCCGKGRRLEMLLGRWR